MRMAAVFREIYNKEVDLILLDLISFGADLVKGKNISG